jgi:6-phosphogluconate dehydrogenase (decarboxylating)
MIGPGMGTNMMPQLGQAGQEVLPKKEAAGWTSVVEFAHELKQPRALWVPIPEAAIERTPATRVPLVETDDVVVDGGHEEKTGAERQGVA